MNKRYNICSSCGNNRAIVNVRYGLCQKCNKQRLINNKMRREEDKGLYEPNTAIPLTTSDVLNRKTPERGKPRYIKRVSDKRKKQEEDYKKVKQLKKDYMIDRKFYRCLFCNVQLDPEDQTIDWHHIVLRNEKNLCDWKNIAPVHRNCHSMYHHSADLLKTPWYNHFLTRLKDGAKNNEYFRKAFNNELRRLQKGGVYDNEMFLKEYINE